MVLKNLWSRIELVCTNHKEPVPMYVYEGSATPFYACPKYMRKDEDHPDGHEENERGCSNRASFDDIRHIVEKLCQQISDDEKMFTYTDYTGMHLKWKMIEAVVLKYSDTKIVIGIHNTKEIGAWQER